MMNSFEQPLRETDLFDALDDVGFKSVVEAVTTVDFSAGATIITEGEIGEEMYVILDGTVQVFTTTPDGQEIVLAKLEKGDYFGEQALLPGGANRRNASIRAEKDVNLLKIMREDFQRVLAEDSPLKEKLLRIGEKQVRQNLMQQSSLFRTLTIGEGTGDWSEEVVFADGETVFKEGDSGENGRIS
jgi:CRP-like cAMP-binding protein